MSKYKTDKDRIYSIWQGMHNRCYNKNCNIYYKYGNKGIKICDEWNRDNINGFDNFYKWSIDNNYGNKLSIDRIDSKKDYSPQNCRWATYLEQNTHLSMLKTNKSGYKGVSLDK